MIPSPRLDAVNRWIVRSLPFVAALLVLGALGWVAFGPDRSTSSPDHAEVTTPPAKASSLAGTWKAPKPKGSPTEFVVADATGPSVALFASPGVPYAEKPTLANPTWEGLPVVFLVLEQKGPWLRARVSTRPNDLVLWIQRSEVSLRTVPNRVVVEVGARRMTVYHGDQVLLQDSVGVGTTRTPTPIGHFFVDGVVPLDGSGPYGTGQVSVSGFSNVLHSFGGGVGQIALHGTNRPQLVGQEVSNGCVRMRNETLDQLLTLAPLGTPVTIVA